MRPLEILACLERHGVDYVVVGMLAATIHGSPFATLDADICPDAEPENLERLARALREMDAQLRSDDPLGLVNGGPSGVPFECSGAALARGGLLELLTRYGELDLVFKPAGSTGFDDLDARASDVSLGGVSVRVASLADVIRSKQAADRPKDRRVLPLLHQLAEELRRRG